MVLSDYLALFPGASREKERFMALVEAVLRQSADLMNLVEMIQPGYSFAAAEGKQLDAAAEAVGLERENGMTDEAFRQYVLHKLKLWAWDGTNEGVSAALPEGVSETDNGNGTVTVRPAGTGQDLLPIPPGVRMIT